MQNDRELKVHQREMWARGDYHKIARGMLWELGPMLVHACGIGPGQRVLDVAAGTGNVAIRAAEAGAVVVASDLTPENFAAGKAEARAHGVELEWVEADAEALPFADASFDVVTSTVGAIFAPHHQTVADELLRVCRPGGTVGLITLVPTGVVSDMFEMLARYDGDTFSGEESPLEWGREEHVRTLFGDRVSSLRLEHRKLAPNPLDDLDTFKANHPIVLTLYCELSEQPERRAALDRELDAIAQRARHGSQELLLIVARKR